jgi:hypothetical protein
VRSKDELPALAEAKRRTHAGGDFNHRFNGERYLNCPDKHTRRMQLGVCIDEGGQTTVGGPQVSHPLLSRWESYAYGLTPEEIDALERADADPGELVRQGWWIHMNRTNHFAIATGSGKVVEGEFALHSQEMRAAVDRDRDRFAAWGIPDIERALLNRYEHAGVDIEHTQHCVDTIKHFVNTPELQDEMRRVFILRLQMFTRA